MGPDAASLVYTRVYTSRVHPGYMPPRVHPGYTLPPGYTLYTLYTLGTPWVHLGTPCTPGYAGPAALRRGRLLGSVLRLIRGRGSFSCLFRQECDGWCARARARARAFSGGIG